MNYTNLNIVDTSHQFKYILEKQDGEVTYEQYSVFKTDTGFQFNPVGSGMEAVVRNKEYWKDQTFKEDDRIYTNDNVVHLCNVNLYFPVFSVDTYARNVRYALTISTWMRGQSITLLSTIVDRNDITAIPTGPRKFLNRDYYEVLSLRMPDPYYIIYDGEWQGLRDILTGGQTDTNEGGSNLHATLCPVEQVNGLWVKMPGYTEAQSQMLLTDKVDSYLSCHIWSNTKEETETPAIICRMGFNSAYEQTTEGLTRYLEQTYGMDATQARTRFSLVVKDKDNIYKHLEHVDAGFIQETSFTAEELHFGSWSEMLDGLQITVAFTLLDAEDDEIEWFSIISNSLFLDEDLFRFFVGENEIKNIKLNELPMDIYHIDVVNKIENQVVSIERPDDYKSNIIKPVFFRAADVDHITIHPAVTENICINLDAYKNKVNVFSLKIKDWTFVETGRVAAGVVFKIVGEKIEVTDTNVVSGIYYILDDNGELVTTGKYTVEI